MNILMIQKIKKSYNIDIDKIFDNNKISGDKLFNNKSDLFEKKNNISSHGGEKTHGSSESEELNIETNNLEIEDILKFPMEEKGKKYTVEFITKLGKYFFIGSNMILYIYDQNMNLIKEKKINWIYNIISIRESEDNLDKFEISICTRDEIKFFECQKDNINPKKELSKNLKSLYLMKRDNLNEYYICTTDNTVLTSEKTNEGIYKIFKGDKFLTKSGIKVNDSLIVFKSNKVVSKGKDKIKMYNYRNKTISDILSEDEEYSFIFSPNGLEIMGIDKENKIKVLLCACKKYTKNQKNGILVVNFENNNCINHFFHETNNFEVYCFCPLYKINRDIIFLNPKAATCFFFVGGFDLYKRKGVIKIYKLINENNYCRRIEYLLDFFVLEDNNKEKFKEPVSCITLSIIDRKLLIGCWDGNVVSINYFGQNN